MNKKNKFLRLCWSKAVNLDIEIGKLTDMARDAFAGQEFVILVDYHNQPFGTSKRNRKGDVTKAGKYGIWAAPPDVLIVPEGCYVPLKLTDVEFLD